MSVQHIRLHDRKCLFRNSRNLKLGIQQHGIRYLLQDIPCYNSVRFVYRIDHITVFFLSQCIVVYYNVMLAVLILCKKKQTGVCTYKPIT